MRDLPRRNAALHHDEDITLQVFEVLKCTHMSRNLDYPPSRRHRQGRRATPPGVAGIVASFLVAAAGVCSGAGEPPAARLTLRHSLTHNNAVYWAAFSRDGKKLATASLDNTVKLWNVADGKHVGTLKGHGDGVAFVGFLPDGTIATASLDRSLKVWSADGSAATLTLTGHQDYLSCGALSMSGRLLVSGGFDKTVRLWDTQAGAALATLTGHTGNVQAVAVSPNGRIVASGGDDRTIRLWDVPTKKVLRTLNGHNLTVDVLTFSPKGDLLASGSSDGSARFWSLDGKSLATIDGGSVGAKSLAFSPDGRLLAIGGSDGAIRLMRVSDRRELSRTSAHKNSVYCVTFNPGGTLLASAGFDRVTHVWEVQGK